MARLTSNDIDLKATEGPYTAWRDEEGAFGIHSKDNSIITYAFELGFFEDNGNEAAQLSFPEAEANSNLLAASWDLFKALEMQVRNCPVCKGEGMAIDVMDLLDVNLNNPGRKPDLKPCTRCLDGREALYKALGKTYVAEEVA